MDANKILHSSMLDIVFDTRNKSYGAYELRNSYQRRIIVALSITGTLILLTIVGTSFAMRSDDAVRQEKERIIVIAETIDETPPEETPPPTLPPPEEPVKTIQNTTIKLVDEPDVTPPPTQEELSTAKTSLVTNDSERPDDNLVMPADLGDKSGILEVKKVEPEIFEKVEIDAQFPGGLEKWRKFLERNANSAVATDNGAPVGQYRILIRFVVDEEGNVSDVRPMTNLGYGMEAEAIRLIKKAASMKWIPAQQNGRTVKAYRTQPITFEVNPE